MNRRRWWLLTSFFLFSLVIGFLIAIEDTADIEKIQQTPYLPPVSVIAVQPEDNHGIIQAFTRIKPRWETTIKSQVNGKIKKVGNKAFAGESVNKGDVLIHIEDSAYLASVHEAKLVLAEAELNLLQEENKSRQAKRDWQRSGLSKSPTDLAVNKPQTKVAKIKVSTAKSILNAARTNHAYARIKAPFSGIVTSRFISIGQTVTEGEELLHIISNEQLDITVSISPRQWNTLAENWQGKSTSIRDKSGIEIARAKIKRGGGFLDQKTHQYKLFLEIDDATSQLLAGDFVEVLLPGAVTSNSIRIPESALTREGTIWYVDDEDRLRQFVANVFFHQDDYIVIDTPSIEAISNHYPKKWRIATTPLASFLSGKLINPVFD